MSELKPCPFCGAEAQYRSTSFGDDLIRICCSVCTASTDFYPHNDYPTAEKYWNNRPAETALLQQVATLTEQHEKQLNDAAETVNKLAVDITTLTEQLRQANEDAERFAKLLRSKDRDYHKGDGYGLSIAEEELLKLHRARIQQDGEG